MGNVILVGMPSSGKTTIGIALARVMDRQFVDMDDRIARWEGMKLQEIIDNNGNEYFHSIERMVCLNFCEDNRVVATGGSAIYAEDAMERFRENGVIVYLKIRVETAEKRLTNLATRGVTLAPGQTIRDLYEYRVPFYERHADLTIETDDRSVASVVLETLTQLNRFKRRLITEPVLW